MIQGAKIKGGILGMLLILTACTKKDRQLPIPEEELVGVLMDVHIAEAGISFLYGLKRDTFVEDYYEDIYTIHDISPEEFEQTMDVLRNDPELMARVYQNILDSLDTRVPD